MGKQPLNSSNALNSGNETALRRYDLQLTLLPNCELLNEPPTTLERIVGSAEAAEAQWMVRDGRDCGSWRRGDAGWSELRLAAWDRLGISIVAEAVPRLRRLRGLRALAEDASDDLGERRRYRCLVEAVLSLNSPLVGLTAIDAAGEALMETAAIWAVRQASLGRDDAAAAAFEPTPPLLASSAAPASADGQPRRYVPELADLSASSRSNGGLDVRR